MADRRLTVVVVGLARFTVFADPAGGNENAPNVEPAPRSRRR
jgi:hypothetical protein